MSCSICGFSVCNCAQSGCVQPDCADPGVIPVGAHLNLLDYKFCDRRLENVAGFLVCAFPEGGTPQIFFTPEPCIQIPELVVGLGTEISHINASLGDAGCMRRLLPSAETDGWLRALNGHWVVSALPSENLPDPFEVENLIVTDTATIENLVVNSTLCFDSLPAGTIETFVGLNASDCLVTGTISQIEAALYYESATLTTASTPNSPIARNTSAIIGNEIFDPQNIASIVSTTRIKVDKAGSYLIFWTGFFNRNPNNDSANGEMTLNLLINASNVAIGSGRSTNVNPPATAVIFGMHLATLAINDTIDIQTGPTTNVSNNLLSDVKVILVKYRT